MQREKSCPRACQSLKVGEKRVTAKGDREEVPREIGGKPRESKFLETMSRCFNKK